MQLPAEGGGGRQGSGMNFRSLLSAVYFTVTFATRIVILHFDTTAGSKCAAGLPISLISCCLGAAFPKPSSSRLVPLKMLVLCEKKEGWWGKGTVIKLVQESSI